ncbi:phosphocholine cytidylyltransferase family protein, partial [bacterium]|nr:phosphocholine cytidylyltransferase family protein [bacterium]
MIGIILAAGRGSRLKTHTEDSPKCLTTLHGKTLLDWQIEAMEKARVHEIVAVTGYMEQMLASKREILTRVNADWSSTNMVSSLCIASDILTASAAIVSYSDIIYPAEAVSMLIKADSDIAITYDVNWLDLWQLRFKDPLEDAESFRLDSENFVSEIGLKATSVDQIQGQYMGLLKFKPEGWCKVKQFLNRYSPMQ